MCVCWLAYLDSLILLGDAQLQLFHARALLFACLIHLLHGDLIGMQQRHRCLRQLGLEPLDFFFLGCHILIHVHHGLFTLAQLYCVLCIVLCVVSETAEWQEE